MENKRVLYGALASSQDPSALGLKVQGVILGLSSVIIYFAAQMFHIQLGASDVVMLATEVGGVIGAIAAVFGSIRHLVTWAATKTQE